MINIVHATGARLPLFPAVRQAIIVEEGETRLIRFVLVVHIDRFIIVMTIVTAAGSNVVVQQQQTDHDLAGLTGLVAVQACFVQIHTLKAGVLYLLYDVGHDPDAAHETGIRFLRLAFVVVDRDRDRVRRAQIQVEVDVPFRTDRILADLGDERLSGAVDLHFAKRIRQTEELLLLQLFGTENGQTNFG